MKKFVTSLALFGALASVSACSANGDRSTVSTDNLDAQLFSPKSLMGSDLGLIGSKTIVLTFDDGPFGAITPQVLDYVESQQIRVSFFMQGNHVDGNEHLLERMREGGHSIGNHTFDHTGLKGLSKKSWDLVYDELSQTDRKISPYVGPAQHIYFRAPGGSWTPNHTIQMNLHEDLQKYIGPIYWDIGGVLVMKGGKVQQAADWDCWVHKLSARACAEGYMNEMNRKQGGIVLMHDREQGTADMIKILIPEWKRQGYKFITMDEVPGIEKYR